MKLKIIEIRQIRFSFFNKFLIVALSNSAIIIFSNTENFSELFNLTIVGQKRLSLFLTINFIFLVSILLRFSNYIFISQLLISFLTIELVFFEINNLSIINFSNWFDVLLKNLVIQYFLAPIFLFNFVTRYEQSFQKLFKNNSQKLIAKKYNLFFILLLIYIPVFLKIFSSDYLIGYWFTNYNHGFIRRGLLGTFFINLPLQNNLKILFVNFFVSSIYILIIYSTLKLLQESQKSYMILLAFSQYFLMYPLWDHLVIGRPEILGILVILLLANYGSDKNKPILDIAFLILFNIATFTHEVNLFFLIPIIYLLSKFEKKLLIVLFIVSTFMYLFFHFQNSELTEEMFILICNDIKDLTIRENICNGAIKFLKVNESVEGFYLQNFTFNIFKAYHFSYFSYIIPILFSLLPFFFLFNTKKQRNLFFLIIVSFLPLFLLAKDWGRWLSLLFIINTVIFFTTNSQKVILNKYLIFLFIVNVIFFMNPHCCSVDVLVFSNVPNNIIFSNFSLYVITFLVVVFREINLKYNKKEGQFN